MQVLLGAQRGSYSGSSSSLWSALPLTCLLLVLLLGVGPTGVDSFVPREYRDPEREAPRGEQQAARFGDVVRGQDDGYSYVPEGELMENDVSDSDLEDGERDPRTKRERCYCDLDLFCKRFGCRRRKRVSATRMQSEMKRAAGSKADLILQLARRLTQNGRNYHSQ